MPIKVKKTGPGSLPMYGALHVGRDCDAYRDLTWKRACKEAEKNDGRSGISLSLVVRTAPDDHTPYASESWPDVRDVRGALRAAREAVTRGRARYAEVVARAQRCNYPYGMPGGRASWDMGGFEVAEEEGK